MEEQVTYKCRDLVAISCVGCGITNSIEFKKIKTLRAKNRDYKCNSCAHGGDGSGTSPSWQKILIACIGCGVEKLVIKSSLIKLRVEGRCYRCTTCNLRGDGVGTETPLGRDKISVVCLGCGKKNKITYRDYKTRNELYRCVTCAIRGDGVGIETPKSIDYVPTSCHICNNKFPVQVFNLKALAKKDSQYTCMRCATGGASKKEEELVSFLETCSVGVLERNTSKYLIDIPRNKEIDIYLPKQKIGIEYNGLIWHSERFKKDKQYHVHKRELAEKQNIRLFQINSDEWEFKQLIVKSILKQSLGLTDNKYHARKLKVRRSSSLEAQIFLKENHLMGTYKIGSAIGLYQQDRLIQLFLYRLLKGGTVLECVRICGLLNTSVVGGISRLIKHTIREHPLVQKVISFVDLRYATGDSLLKLGFKREGITLSWKWTDGKVTFNRLQCRANMDSRKLSQRQHAEELKWYKVYDAGQAKFVLDII